MKPALVAVNKEIAHSARELFRTRFQRSLRECLRHGFAIEESFGLVWEETLDEVCLLEAEQSALYEELIDWARDLPAYSPFLAHVIHREKPLNQRNP